MKWMVFPNRIRMFKTITFVIDRGGFKASNFDIAANLKSDYLLLNDRFAKFIFEQDIKLTGGVSFND